LSKTPPYKKGTILVPSGGTNHLHIMCNDPIFDARFGEESVLVVNITFVKGKVVYDKSCILDKGDHPSIHHPSYVYYKESAVYQASSILSAVDSGEYIPKQDLLDDTFNRVLLGFEVTDETAYKITRFYERHCKLSTKYKHNRVAGGI
jgi:hypothetical protein